MGGTFTTVKMPIFLVRSDSDKWGMKTALITTLSLNIFGNILYALAYSVSPPRLGGAEDTAGTQEGRLEPRNGPV